MIRVTQNFNWDDTAAKDLVIFLPNHNGKALTEFSISRIRTVCPTDKWVIIIGNDGNDDDFSHLATQNVAFFTIHRDPGDRNSGFIRNYAIKRSRSRWFCQKDGEVCVEGDFISQIVLNQKGDGWRAGYATSLTQEQTSVYLQDRGLDVVSNLVMNEIPPARPIPDLVAVRDYLSKMDGRLNFTTFFQYIFCVQTSVLQALRGYDETLYTSYGFEDTEMYLRLAPDVSLNPDYSCCAVHPWHPRSFDNVKLEAMARAFQKQDPRERVRNPVKWGEGE